MQGRAKLEAPNAGTTRRNVIAGAAVALGGLFVGAPEIWAEAGDVARTAESIHQEPAFAADRKRVYEVLTDSKQFDRVVELSGALKSMKLRSNLTEINCEAGGTFTIFGGHIIGRHLELVVNERIVQAWRVVDWGSRR